jgi:hypothetical protein
MINDETVDTHVKYFKFFIVNYYPINNQVRNTITIKRSQNAIFLLEGNERTVQEKTSREFGYNSFKCNISKAAFLSFLFLSTFPRERENHEEKASFAKTQLQKLPWSFHFRCHILVTSIHFSFVHTLSPRPPIVTKKTEHANMVEIGTIGPTASSDFALVPASEAVLQRGFFESYYNISPS